MVVRVGDEEASSVGADVSERFEERIRRRIVLAPVGFAGEGVDLADNHVGRCPAGSRNGIIN